MSAVGCSRATFYLHFRSNTAVLIKYLTRVWPSVDGATDDVAATVARGITKRELRERISDQLLLWRAVEGAPTAISVTRLTDPDVRVWLDTKNTRSIAAVVAAATHQPGHVDRVRRSRIALLTNMTSTAMSLEDNELQVLPR